MHSLRNSVYKTFLVAVISVAFMAGNATASQAASRDSGYAWDTYSDNWAHFRHGYDLADVYDGADDGTYARGKFTSPSKSYSFTNYNGKGWTNTFYPDFPEGEQVKVVACRFSKDSVEYGCGAPSYGVA